MIKFGKIIQTFKSDALKKATEAVDAPPKKRGGIFGFFDSAESIGSGLKKTGDVIGSGFKAVGSGLIISLVATLENLETSYRINTKMHPSLQENNMIK